MNACDWKKYPEPVFSAKNGVYAPGHNANFYSPDGKETWNVYHAVSRFGTRAQG
jgi:GH43 family beta-xylosidase